MKIASREDIRRENRAAVFVADAFEHGGVWLHELTTAKLDEIREVSYVPGSGRERIDLRALNALKLIEAMRTGPEPDAPRLYQPGEQDALRAEVRPGTLDRLLNIVDALLGYETPEAPFVRASRPGPASPPGCCDGAESSPPS